MLVYQKKSEKGIKEVNCPLWHPWGSEYYTQRSKRVFDSIYSNTTEYIKTNASFQLPNFHFKVKILINKDSKTQNAHKTEYKLLSVYIYPPVKFQV